MCFCDRLLAAKCLKILLEWFSLVLKNVVYQPRELFLKPTLKITRRSFKSHPSGSKIWGVAQDFYTVLYIRICVFYWSYRFKGTHLANEWIEHSHVFCIDAFGLLWFFFEKILKTNQTTGNSSKFKTDSSQWTTGVKTPQVVNHCSNFIGLF